MIAAVIPTRYQPPELAALLNVLAADHVEPIVLDSMLHAHRIYRMWNYGVEIARGRGATEIAVLNDDVTLLPHSLPLMATALRAGPEVAVVYPDENASFAAPLPVTPALEATQGTWGAGGMTGFAFMFRAELPLPPFDEGFGWWYGDDAWEAAVRGLGYSVCRVVGVPVRHMPNGSAARDWDRLAPIVERDRARWERMDA